MGLEIILGIATGGALLYLLFVISPHLVGNDPKATFYLRLILVLWFIFSLYLGAKATLDNDQICNIELSEIVTIQNVSANGLVDIYGEMSAYNGAGNTITISDTTNYFNITGFGMGDLSGVTYSDDDLTLTQDGVYKIDWALSFGGGVSDTWHIALFKNGAALTECNDVLRKVGTGGDVGAAANTCLADLNANDVIDLRIRNADGTDNAVVYYQSVNLHKFSTVNVSSEITTTETYNYDLKCVDKLTTTGLSYFNLINGLWKVLAAFVVVYLSYLFLLNNGIIKNGKG